MEDDLLHEMVERQWRECEGVETAKKDVHFSVMVAAEILPHNPSQRMFPFSHCTQVSVLPFARFEINPLHS
jgi:hypothetical protein